VQTIINDFMDELFGNDGYADDEGTLVHASVTRFINTLLANSWNRLRKWIKADKAKLDKEHGRTKVLWEGMSDF